MRFLSFHCDYFNYTVKNKSRSKIIEELTELNKQGELKEVVVLFISVEKQDEERPHFLEDVIKEIKKISIQLKVSNLVILSFAHLFGELSEVEFGFNTLKKLEKMLKDHDFTILRPPYGWFNELELKAKGHPLSRISRII